MKDHATSLAFEDALDPEARDYRPMSPMAVISLICAGLSVIAAIIVGDIGPWMFAVVPVLGVIFGLYGTYATRRYDMRGRGLALAGLSLSAACLVGGEALSAYLTAVEVPPGAVRISYEELQPKEGESLASTAQALDGKKVFIKGYVYPTDQMTGIKSFLLCRDKGQCCFGGQPKPTDTIQVSLEGDLALNYDQNLHAVAGVFRVAKGGMPGGAPYLLTADVLR